MATARRKFRLIAGQAICPDLTQQPNENGKYPSKTYNQGEVILSEVDLSTKHGSNKFQYLGDQSSRDDKFDMMSDKQLFAYAADNDIDVTKTHNREEVLRIIRDADAVEKPVAKATPTAKR